jgi:hypothetical protein
MSTPYEFRDAAALLAADYVALEQKHEVLTHQLQIERSARAELLSLLHAAYKRINDQESQMRQLLEMARD